MLLRLIIRLITAFLVFIGACQPPADKPEPVTGDVLALTYNVAGLPDALSGSNPEVNMPLIGDRLDAYDLVLLQESWLTPDPNPLGDVRTYHEELVARSSHPHKSDPLPAPLGLDPRRPSALLSDGLNRFSDVPFGPVRRDMWTNCGEASADCLALKGLSVARTALAPGVEVDVYNLHMEAGGPDAALRGENVEQLIAVIADYSAGRPVIVGGDFNLHIDEEPDAAQFAQLLTEAGLTDVCTDLSCPEPERIDKFLYRSTKDVRLTPTEWRNDDPDFRRDDGEPLSDHDPVAVVFAFEADPPT